MLGSYVQLCIISLVMLYCDLRTAMLALKFVIIIECKWSSGADVGKLCYGILGANSVHKCMYVKFLF